MISVVKNEFDQHNILKLPHSYLDYAFTPGRQHHEFSKVIKLEPGLQSQVIVSIYKILKSWSHGRSRF